MLTPELNNIITSGDFIVLDTETTGLGFQDEICEIAIVDSTGKKLLCTLVKPTCRFNADAIAIHQITPELVQESPEWVDIRREVERLITGRNVLVYNAKFDRMMMHQSDDAHDVPHTEYSAIASWFCVMTAYARIWGQWSEYKRDWKWQSLSNALSQQGIVFDNLHGALEDCLATLELAKTMVRSDVKTLRKSID